MQDGSTPKSISRRSVATLAQAYQLICDGERPWTALGNFMNEWFDYCINQRPLLIAEAIRIPTHATTEMIQWAAFCVASVEWLCTRYDVPQPQWTDSLDVWLVSPWFHAFHPEPPQVREQLRASTPAPFARRNIFCGDRVFANKYEFVAQSRAWRQANTTQHKP